MKSFLPLLSLAMTIASCSTAYKSGQTPDDVYFSPERPQVEYASLDNDDDRRYRGQDYNRSNQEYYSYEDDRYLRMKVRNRDQWSYLDDYYRDPYAYNPFANNYYSYNRYYSNSYWNPRLYWNYCYNPYAPNVVVVNPKTPVYTKPPRTYNLHVFDDPKTNTYNPKATSTRTREYNTYSDNNSRRNVGNELRDIFRSSEGSPSRSSSSSGSSSSSSRGSDSKSSSSGKSGSSGPARRF